MLLTSRKTTMDNGKYLFMITGAPGAGKSTLA